MNRTSVLDDLVQRDLVASATDLGALREDLAKASITMYCGFDPTAPSLHMGNLAQIVTMMRFQQAGHKPLALVGGSTGLIGDPRMTGERAMNAVDVVRDWEAKIKAQLEHFFDFSGEYACRMVNNFDWTKDVTAIDFLRDIGKHFSVNRMLDREAVSARLNSTGISYTEFSYQLLQAFDFLELYRRYDCVLQTGGSDQWGNITAGTDLIRRIEGVTVHALTTPLITKADGTKFGKTEAGTVWLDARKTSVYRFYQFWINTADNDVVRFLKYFTFLSREEIEALEKAHAANPGAREAHRALAKCVTDLIHGESATHEAIRASEILFGAPLEGISEATFNDLVGEVPTKPLERAKLDGPGTLLTELLVHAGLCPSKGQARKDVEGGGIYVNNVREANSQRTVTSADLLFGKHVLLRKGKKNYTVLTVS